MEYQFKGTQGEYKVHFHHGRNTTQLQVVAGKYKQVVHSYTLDKEDQCPVENCGCISYEMATAKMIAIAGNLAQKFDPETWETRLTQFEEMKTALGKRIKYLGNQLIYHRSVQNENMADVFSACVNELENLLASLTENNRNDLNKD